MELAVGIEGIGEGRKKSWVCVCFEVFRRMLVSFTRRLGGSSHGWETGLGKARIGAC